MNEAATHTGGDKVLAYEMPDELTQHELEEAIKIMRWIKRHQVGYLLVSPSFGDGRALHIAGPLGKMKMAA